MKRSYVTASEINSCSLVKFDEDGKILPASSSTDKIIGIAENVHAAEGVAMDVILSGACEVIAGGSIAAGDAITSDESGLAISAGDGDNIAGYALSSGEEGDVIPVIAAIQRNTI